MLRNPLFHSTGCRIQEGYRDNAGYRLQVVTSIDAITIKLLPIYNSKLPISDLYIVIKLMMHEKKSD